MKKRLSILTLTIIFVIISCTSVFADIDPLFDPEEYFTQEQSADLYEKLLDVSYKHELEVGVAVTGALYSDTAMASADDIYDYHGFGMGENDDGILFYIAIESRDYWFSTYQKGMDVFNDIAIAGLKDTVLPYLSDSDYYGACLAYIEKADQMLTMYENGTPYGSQTGDSQGQREKPSGTPTYIVAAIIAFLFARIKTRGKERLAKTAIKQDYAASYMKPDSMKLSLSKDIFVYSHVNKVKKPDKDSGGGSSSHVSSSGRSHGGGGGKF